jgi:hypothetical protein
MVEGTGYVMTHISGPTGTLFFHYDDNEEEDGDNCT